MSVTLHRGGLTFPFAVYIMENPIFVVLRKYFYAVNGIDTPFTPDGGDIMLFGSYEAAKEHALTWCGRMARRVSLLCDCGELSAAACQCDYLVLQCVGHECYDNWCVRVGCEVYQKYVL